MSLPDYLGLTNVEMIHRKFNQALIKTIEGLRERTE